MALALTERTQDFGREQPLAVEELATNYALAAQMPQLDSLIVVPLAILDFLCIDPFADGNGRMSRLLTLMLLYHFNYEVGRYISIERVYEQTKEGVLGEGDHAGQAGAILLWRRYGPKTPHQVVYPNPPLAGPDQVLVT